MLSARLGSALLSRTNSLIYQPTRSKWEKKIRVFVYPSLQERLEELDVTRDDPELYAPVNIGLPHINPSRREQLNHRLQYRKSLRQNPEIEKLSRSRKLAVDINKVREEWDSTSGPHHIRTLAEHYGIFRDLYGCAYFIPRVALRINYNFDDEMVSPVYRGNTIKPREASTCPTVQFKSEPNELWTLVLTNPDGNLLENKSECLHWFIGNIPGGDIASGEVICDYLQPFPPRGIGYQRLVFVLYKQDGRIDYSNYKKEEPCLSLKERSFSSLTFYRELQDVITPAGLSWFQSDWDSSLTNFFHHTLKMKEPVYEYEFPPLYLAPQKYFPLKRPFNSYMDLHRDPKEISKEILLQRLKKLNPLEREKPVLPFPGAIKFPKGLTNWEKKDFHRKNLGIGKYRDLYKGSNRPEV
ncbi:large ribosomal subunit protein mL38 isoform X1 [Procambarus clarkii]|uniref:large ribosomal subunit protein mL38 isoform X1 n=1 Tax=Procambarus clarkii TaxID=6728 RepID=UPI001E670C9A|nr:39S ribosomal protein L38, mitochondrial-like [Procambarus clarkii]